RFTRLLWPAQDGTGLAHDVLMSATPASYFVGLKPDSSVDWLYTSSSSRRIMHGRGFLFVTDLRITILSLDIEAMADEKVLVVDDEVGMLTLLHNYLTREGYEAHTAPSGEIALQFLEEHDFDVVLTDLRMGGMDGLGLVREIHATRPETPV